MKNMFEYPWIIGDPWGDGHGKIDFQNLIITTDMEMCDCIDYLKHKFEKDCERQFGLHVDKWFVDYQETAFPKEDYDKLVEMKVIDDTVYDCDETFVTSEAFAEIWRRLVQLTNPAIKIEFGDRHDMPWIEPTGGYGLTDY
jgi:hypothetical protein